MGSIFITKCLEYIYYKIFLVLYWFWEYSSQNIWCIFISKYFSCILILGVYIAQNIFNLFITEYLEYISLKIFSVILIFWNVFITKYMENIYQKLFLAVYWFLECIHHKIFGVYSSQNIFSYILIFGIYSLQIICRIFITKYF